MIQVFKTDEEYVKWLDGQTLPSGIVVYVSEDETMYFSTNNIKGELKTYKCEKEEPIQYPPLIYSAKSAGSTITVNGQSMTLEQGDNMVLEYPTAITSVKATNNTALTAITIPNTVTSIEDNAFGDCDALSEITLPDSLTSIGVGAFQLCIGLTSINIPSGVTSISMETFNGCSALASVTLPEGLTNIGSSTFMDCTSLTSITIPSTVTMIDFEAFNYCEALTDFNFNGTMAQWGAITLGDGWKDNAAFTVVHCTDGDVTLEEPIIYPPLVYSTNAAGSTITVNGETVTLAKGDNITLDYPNEITSVKATSNTALTYIQIPNTVVSINDNAFTGCTALTDFNYNGTVEQWGAITLGTDWNTDAAFTVVHCTDGDVTLEEPIQPIQHEYVDLGLPSGLKWAKCNVGATSETDAGLYFAWGETTGYTASQVGTDKSFLWSNYKYGNSSSNLTKYNQSDGKTVLESVDDAATQIIGGGWRVPTKAEFQELLNNTDKLWATINGVNGMKFTSKTDTSNYIFIPAAGYCNYGSVDGVGNYGNVWSSSLDTSDPSNAWRLYFQSGYCNMNNSDRCNGMSVRGVRK